MVRLAEADSRLTLSFGRELGQLVLGVRKVGEAALSTVLHATSCHSGRTCRLNFSRLLYGLYGTSPLAACCSKKDRARDGNIGAVTVNGNCYANRIENILYPYGKLYKMSHICSVLGLKKSMDQTKL